MPADSSVPQPASRNRTWLILTVLVLLAALVWFLRGRIHFDWATLGRQLRFVSITRVLIAILLTYICYWIRALRWSVLLSPVTKLSANALFPAQAIGFTSVALFGRVADLARPYLIARRAKTPVATQLAIYSVERAFDLGAAAVLFSVTLALAPRNMPHHSAFARAGVVSMGATLFLVVFAIALRFAGDKLARLAARLLHPLSPRFAEAAHARILDFHDGFRTVSSLGEFALALLLSLVMWTGIAFVYVESAHAFQASPELATLSFSATMLLLATGIGGSLLQLPVIGWFTQIAVLAAALHGFFGVPLETATACGAIILLTTNLCIIPGGAIAARLQGIALNSTVVSFKF
jgi:hypothetical protein